ncbi:MAG TPA: PQQ-binding-like beta-propeller repeat protein, partial [bacterium]|nr:PQQ-binding-like beta-propeller repeat protein [bacterium]
PLICGSTLFIGAANKKLYALSLADGRELWSFTAKGRISTSPVVFGGRLIFAAGYDYLYCFALR